MNKERELAKTIYVLVESVKNNDKAIKGIIAEEVGRILIEAKEKNIHTKTLLLLLDLYLKDIARETQAVIRSNRGIIYEADKERIGFGC